MIKILRVEQWTKNFIIFIPTILANNFQVLSSYKIYIVFLSFSLLASSTYIFNDIKDVEQDRIHPEKKFRPLASGSLNLKVASIYLLVLLILSFLIIYIINYDLILLYFAYLTITIFYSSKLKYIKYLDFLSITVLFGIRILIGASAARVELTTSFILFLLFILTLISVGKKLSILNNKNISGDSRVKKHLVNSYSSLELQRLCSSLSFLSLLVFVFWNFQYLNFPSLQLIVSILSIILLYIFNRTFINDSVNAATENFVEWIITSKNLYIVTLLCLLTLIIIY